MGAGKAREIAVGTMRDVRAAMGVGAGGAGAVAAPRSLSRYTSYARITGERNGRAGEYARTQCVHRQTSSAPLRLVDLELDLEVFAGAVDLLLTLILRRRSTCSKSTSRMS